MRTFTLPEKEYVDKCPCCHKHNLDDVKLDTGFGLAKVAHNNKLDDKNFIRVSIKKCPECGAIFLFEEK